MDDVATPLVSVIIPTVDREDFLQAAVESVADQTYRNIELILVDDTDRPSAERLPGIRSDAIVETKHIHGLDHDSAGAARNTGIRAASGKFLAFLDDDDRWEPTKIERQVRVLQQANEDVGAVFTGQKYTDSEGHIHGIQNETPTENETEQLLRGDPLNPFSCAMVRADVVADVGYIDERFHFWEDREWFLRISEQYGFEGIAEPLTIRRMGDHEQLSDDFEAKEAAYHLFLDKHRELAASYGTRSERRFIASTSRSVGFSGLDNDRYESGKQYLRRSIRYWPFDTSSYLLYFLALGDGRMYRFVRFLKRKYNYLLSGRA